MITNIFVVYLLNVKQLSNSMKDRKTKPHGFRVTIDEDSELRKLASVNRMDISEILHKGMHLMFKLLKTK